MTAACPNDAGANIEVITVLSDSTSVCSALEFCRSDRADICQVSDADRFGSELIGARFDPLIQTTHTFMNPDARLPTSQPAELTRVRDVVALIGRSPVFETDRKVTAVE